MFHSFKRNRRLLRLTSKSCVLSFPDSTKAFDRVNYCKLFKLLVKHELPLLIIRVLANLYMNNLVRVSWGGAMTDYFTALNWVKQGAVLSPILYCVYVDDLLLILSKAGVGCLIGLHFVGALAYAEDLVLLAPTASAMRKLLAISVWLPYLRIVATLSKRSMIVLFTSTV